MTENLQNGSNSTILLKKGMFPIPFHSLCHDLFHVKRHHSPPGPRTYLNKEDMD